MAEDLADQIDDYICVFEGAGDLTMDTFVMLLFALIVLVISLVFATKLIYDKYVLRKGTTTSGTEVAGGSTAATPGTAAGAGAGVTGAPSSSSALAAGARLSEPKEVLTKKVLELVVHLFKYLQMRIFSRFLTSLNISLSYFLVFRCSILWNSRRIPSKYILCQCQTL